MTKFAKMGGMYIPTDETASDIRDKLPGGTYIIKALPNGQLVFDTVGSFVMPKKLYGDCIKNADRIMNTFLARPHSTGAMLNGEKGSGKTLLVKYLALQGEKKGIPTILINNEWTGDSFMQLMQALSQPTIVIFDEFEKVYSEEGQEDILTMLDGVFPSKKLFLFTCNNKWKVNQHMRNRPGRVFYYLEYSGLDSKFIREYCVDNLKNKDNIDSVVVLSHMFDHFNFDMLASIVEEMNRYDENAHQAIAMLNARPEFSQKQTFVATLTIGNSKRRLDEEKLSMNPIVQPAFSVLYYDAPIPAPAKPLKKGEKPPKLRRTRENVDKWKSETFEFKDLVKVEADEGRFIYKKGNATITLVREVPVTHSYDGLF